MQRRDHTGDNKHAETEPTKARRVVNGETCEFEFELMVMRDTTQEMLVTFQRLQTLR